MSRTYKDTAKAKKLAKNKESLKSAYLKNKNGDFEQMLEYMEESECPVCGDDFSFSNGVPFCDSCGWSTAESLIDEMESDEAA